MAEEKKLGIRRFIVLSRLRVWSAAIWLILVTSAFAAGPSSGIKPNIVFILIDDMGWADVGCNGSTFYKTPNIDRLATQGVRFTDAYAAGPVCSPTRAAILTGKSPARLHMTDWLPGRQDRPSQKLLKPEIERHLALEEVTLAEALKPLGYVSGHIGKWHLGGKGYGPEQQGFDSNVGGDDSGSPLAYFAPFRSGARVIPGLETAPAGEYLTDRLTAEAERFLEANRDRPFFLYLAHYAVHIPLAAKADKLLRYEREGGTGRQTNSIYAAMIDSVDEGVGRVLRKLEELKLNERTIVIFTSDNGGLSVKEGPNTPATSNAPLRDGKGYLSEGGIRVPLVVSWPGTIAGARVERTPVTSVDFFPTLIEAAGGRAPNGGEGSSLLPLLKEGQGLSRDALYWHYPHYSNQGGSPGGAVREEDFKLIQSYEDGKIELYNLKEDVGEQHDLANALPEKASALRTKLELWRKAQGAQMMEPNPDYQAPTGLRADKAAAQMADGTILLHARDVTVHGDTVRYEPQPHKNTIGYWTKLQDWVSWDFVVHEPGTFEMVILQGCGTGSGGSEVEFSVGGESILVKVQETGGFQNFLERAIGQVHLGHAGRFTLSVRPKAKPGLAVMDLRSVTLKPVTK